ncbi:MAG: 3-oxoacyl-(acyl-carrier-protein) synthase [Planctomycetota bacterium]|jgi:3-oxoacyl-(acyl-carrier-protein) synthase
MSSEPKIIALGLLDETGIASTSMPCRTWDELESQAPGGPRTYRALTGKQDQTFRRLDRATRTLVLAAEASGLSQILSDAERDECALIVETSTGCIEADLRYARLLNEGTVHAAIFPYTLQSTSLGDVTLRHGLRGVTLSLSIAPGGEGEALREARRVLCSGAAPYALVASVDVLDEPLPGTEPVLRAVTCLLAAPEMQVSAITAWPVDAADPFSALAKICREHSQPSK